MLGIRLPSNDLMRNPSGTWSFVGRVDAHLAYVRADGSPARPEELADAAKFGPHAVGLVSRTFPTRDAALHAAGENRSDLCQCELCRTERAAVETVSRQFLEHGEVEYVPEEVE